MIYVLSTKQQWLFIGEFVPAFNLKNMILNYTKKELSSKMWPKFARYWKKKIQIARFLW
jgi:hypothetical protein